MSEQPCKVCGTIQDDKGVCWFCKTHPKKTVIKVKGKEREITLPDRLRLREEQNPECNEKGSLCGLFSQTVRGELQKVCLKIELDEKGDFQGFDMVKCSKQKEKEIKIEEE